MTIRYPLLSPGRLKWIVPLQFIVSVCLFVSLPVSISICMTGGTNGLVGWQRKWNWEYNFSIYTEYIGTDSFSFLSSLKKNGVLFIGHPLSRTRWWWWKEKKTKKPVQSSPTVYLAAAARKKRISRRRMKERFLTYKLVRRNSFLLSFFLSFARPSVLFFTCRKEWKVSHLGRRSSTIYSTTIACRLQWVFLLQANALWY